MREALFVKQNAKKWEKYEKLKTHDPDELAAQFISITDDLAYAKTFYPKSKTTSYLNGLASRYHQSIYRNKKEKGNRFAIFWRTELPGLFKKHQKPLFSSLVFFLIFCVVGALSANYDDTFIRLILGDAYVNMTNENISNGNPFGVYKDQGSFPMFFKIASNNIFVAIYVFVSGIFISVGTLFSLLRNGVMLGSFQYYFFSQGLGLQSVLVIWIHGTLEISAIVIAGAAGLVLGNSILFPGTYSRLESLRAGGKDGIKIIIGLVPIFIVAAFLEGYVTRHTEMPMWLSVSILTSSLLFILWYVIVLPNKNHNKNPKPKSHATED
jgi:uncharacterized membrane protein SpoIIM required for sporulation